MNQFFASLLVIMLFVVQSVTAQSMLKVDRARLQKDRAQRAEQQKQLKTVAKVTTGKSNAETAKPETTPSTRRLEGQNRKPAKRYFYVNGGTDTYDETIPHSGITHSYKISTNDEDTCRIVHIPDWAKVRYLSLPYINIEYDANITQKVRSGCVELSLNGLTAKIHVSQEASSVKTSLSNVYLQHNMSPTDYLCTELRIRGGVEVTGGLNVPLSIIVFFSDSQDDKGWIKARSGYRKLANSDGNLFAKMDFTPDTNLSYKKRFTLRIPNQAFDIDEGVKALYCRVYVYRPDSREYLSKDNTIFYVQNKLGIITTSD